VDGIALNHRFGETRNPMNSPVRSGIPEFDQWFLLPSPGYTVFWTMPETGRDPGALISSLIGSSLDGAGSFVAHSTRSNIDGFLEDLSTYDPRCTLQLLSIGGSLHFIDSYSSKLDLFGQPIESDGMDVRYVTDTCKPRGAGTLSEVFRELREECNLENFIGMENSLSDLAMDMGEYQHIRLFGDTVCRMRSRRGTMVGIADWYSHGETYKANIIHLSDASLLWGISSGGRKTKYLLPIKRSHVSSAASFEPRPYDLHGMTLRLLSGRVSRAASEGSQEGLYG
jgi:hypothetical protein